MKQHSSVQQPVNAQQKNPASPAPDFLEPEAVAGINLAQPTPVLAENPLGSAPVGGTPVPPNELPPSPAASPQGAPVGQPMPACYGGVFPSQASPPVASMHQPFTATRADGLLAIASFLLGYLFIRWMIPISRVGATAFTLLYVLIVLLYARALKIKPTKYSWYWMVILLCTAISYMLFPLNSMVGFQFLLLFGSAIYWCGSLFGNLINTVSSNYYVKDILNLCFVIPFKNFGTAFLGLEGLFKPQKPVEAPRDKMKKTVLPILLGLALSLPVLAILFPILISADQGNFKNIFIILDKFLNTFFDGPVWRNFLYAIFGIPIGLYICGRLAGNAHRRYVNGPDKKRTAQNLQAARLLPAITVNIILMVVFAVYLVFIACQIPYLFSAFAGLRPNGYEVYSAYAREGFFELCAIAGINLTLLLGANLLCNKPRPANKLLKFINLLFSAVTLLLIATALSKITLYIEAYGLTVPRIISSVFLLYLATIYIAVMVLQFKQFSIGRFGLVLGSGLLCLLCLSNPDGWAVRYNANQYIAGNLKDFNAWKIYDGGEMSIQAGLDVLENTRDKGLARDIKQEICDCEWFATSNQGTHLDTFSDYQIRKMDLSSIKSEQEERIGFHNQFP